jgi:hypothetical protein
MSPLTSRAGLALALGLVLALPAAAQVYTYQQTLGANGVTGADNGHFNNPVGGSVDTVNGHYRAVAATGGHR